MSTKDEFVHTMHAKLDQWNAEIDVLSAKANQAADQAEVEARAEYQKQLDALRSKRDHARSKLNELESASEGAWHDLKAGVELAWESVSEAVRSATARFK
ncbi:MAG TPA: coiled coil domain-containing protein [Thiobacillus sp.]|nr:coiled coil domain-containing protein [Thiobacillus sp.]